ncbi:MAG: M23 family metallopeptidase [Pseudomonadota bacterium]
MTEKFVHTGQTFTGAGDPYCPLERKRRGPAALAAALSILVAGGVFLIVTATSDPQKATATSLAAPLMVENRVPSAGASPPEREVATVAEVLAESRAARAETSTVLKLAGSEPVTPATGLMPRLKPTADRAQPAVASAEIIKTAGMAPSLKNSSRTAPARPAFIGGVSYASAEDGPPPFFFESDMVRRDINQVAPAIELAADIRRDPQDIRIRIMRGENFVDALKRAGVSAPDANEAAYAFGKHQNLRRLLPGQEMALTLGWPNQTLFQHVADDRGDDARLLSLEFRADPENRILLRRMPDGEMIGEKKAIPLTTRIMSIAGQINGSLYLSAKQVGAPDEVIANLADAFAYDVDFQREIFGGDEFEAIFEVRYDDRGKLISAGDILYARLKWRGRAREKGYYRFEEVPGRGDFYDATGQSAKRLLMKTPIDGARLSSGFGTRRHPILGYRRAHKGVDFAAPRGTPIKAAGDGVVLRANRYGSFGNYIKIRHANGYETAYAHLNGFARGIRKGKRVRQGDIIGFVGTTGRSTGPHLHYEVHLNGRAVNPQRLKIATGKQLKGDVLERFKSERERIDAMRMAPEEREALYARGNAGAQGAL